jgi:large subunit ribosomal protein L6
LNLIGIGFRAWCYFDNTRNCQVLCIKVGLSKDVLIFIPSDIVVLCLRPTLILLKGIDKKSVSLLACRIRSIKVPDAYKGKGIRYDNEIVRIKPGKQK